MNVNKFILNSKNLMKLAYPILIAQLVQTLMGFADTVMAGRVSPTDLAAVAIASSVWLPLTLTIFGLIMALATIVSQYAGADRVDLAVKATHQTGWIAAVVGIVFILLFLLIAPLVEQKITLEAPFKTLIFDYLNYIVWGAPGYFLYLVLRNFSEGLSHTKPTMIISLIGLLANIPLNYIFIYGEFGIPAYGGAGCGIATALIYWLMFTCTLIYTYFAKVFAHTQLFDQFYAPNWSQIKSILAIGVPISLSLLFEVSLFGVVAVILAPFGPTIVSSHQIALNFSSIVFMVPLSLGMAVTIKVGFAVGKQSFDEAKELCKYSVILGLLIAIFTAAFTLIFRHNISQIYTNDLQVIKLASSLMFLASLFQFSDAIQVISTGALRGYKDTKAILYITFLSYWLVGLSVGLVLGLTDWVIPKMGAEGFWVGFISGLTIAAILLAWRLKIIQKRVILIEVAD
jgi:MATE family multidrug resistance protein